MSRNSNKLLLLVLPIIFLLAWTYCFWQSRTFYSTYPDSTYIYLINATNIAGGNLDIGHYDNPGTPVHILGGIVVWAVHLFAGKGKVYEDVLADPEFYLRFCASFFALLLLLSVYIAGRTILKYTGNLALALLFQLLPVCSFFTIHYLLLVRMCPEDLIIAVLISYYAFLWALCYQRDKFPGSDFSRKSHLFLFSFVSALLVTTKMTCLPFLIVPLFFIGKFSQKIWYCVLTVIFGAALIYPIWPALPAMYDWFTRLATHSGEYGQGEAGVSAGTLLSNLAKLFDHEWFFTAGYFTLIVVLIIGALKKKTALNFYKLLLASFIVCSLQLLLASKQFGYHYLIASQLLIVPALCAAYYLFSGRETERPKPIFALLAFCFVWFGFKTIHDISRIYPKENPMYLSAQQLKKYAHVPKILTTGYQGTSFIESGIRFGTMYGGPNYYESHYFLRQQYPDSYFYDMNLPQNLVKKWEIVSSPYLFFMDKPQALIYFINMTEQAERQVINKITSELDPAAIRDIKVEYYNAETAERLYMITTDTALLRPRYKQTEIIKPLRANDTVKIKPGEYYGCTTYDIHPGDAFEISVNYFSEDRPIGITLSDPSSTTIQYSSESIMAKNQNGWKTVSLKVILPKDCLSPTANFCLYYFGSGICYATDLNIRVCRNGVAPEQNLPGLENIQKFILKASGGNYLSLMPDHSIAANQPDASKAEVFEKVDLINGLVAFRTSQGFFVSDDRARKSLLIADRKEAQDWEAFRIIGTDASAITIRSSQGMFVCADHSDGDKIVADKGRASTWETFELIKK